MNAAAPFKLPGLSFEAVRQVREPSPLRSDVAGFVGRTRRGPVGEPVRVEGWREYLAVFGGLAADADTTYAIRGYFENEGQVAWVVRVPTPPPPDAGGDLQKASATWDVAALHADPRRAGPLRPAPLRWNPAAGGFPAAAYRVEATSPGAWADGTVVEARYRRTGVGGRPQVDLTVMAPDEPTEHLLRLDPARLKDSVAESSALVRLVPVAPAAAAPAAATGPAHVVWPPLVLRGGVAHVAADDLRVAYLQALAALGEQVEVALLAMPDLWRDLPPGGGDGAVGPAPARPADDVIRAALRSAEDLHDRLVLLDVPPDVRGVPAITAWANGLAAPDDPDSRRAAAVYHPPLRVSDPLGGIAAPLRTVPACGHVAGVISRLDRTRGAHHTPANAPVYEALDVRDALAAPEQAQLIAAGVNLVRCQPGRGLQVWGGRTLETDVPDPALPPGPPRAWRSFVAHRRLVHRLVRAARRVAEPLLFDTNGPELWLAVARGMTSVLLEAFRAGALKGARPEEAFRVACDATTNPPAEREQGRVLCTIEVAPAVPMEFIVLRVALGGDGALEVFES